MTELGLTAGRRMVTLALSALFAAGCGGGENAPAADGSQSLQPAAQPMATEVQSLVDQGNEAQRDGRYQEAMGFYKEAMEMAPGHPIPQFGGLMAALALGETSLADSLRAILEVSSPELVEMLTPGGGMGGEGSMPPDPHGGMGGGGSMPPNPHGGTIEMVPPSSVDGRSG